MESPAGSVTGPKTGLYFAWAAAFGLAVAALVASWMPESERRAVERVEPEVFLTGVEEAEPCDGLSDGVPTELPGENGCQGMQPPLEPALQVIDDPASGGGPGGAEIRTPFVQNPASVSIAHESAIEKPSEAGVTTTSAESPGITAAETSTTVPMGTKGTRAMGYNDEPRSTYSSGSSLFDLQPNSVVQGLSVLEERQLGSVSIASRQFVWGELDIANAGVNPHSGFVFGRRYFSALNHDGAGSTGVRWVTSITEQLVFRSIDGKNALQYMHWEQPFNDPDFYFVEQVPSSDIYEAPAAVGGNIQKDGNLYILTFKDGSKHYFEVADETHARIVERRDPYENSTTFVYIDDPMIDNTTIVITDARGVVYNVTLDALGYVQQITDHYGSVWSFLYQTIGLTKYLTDVIYPSREVYEPNGSIVTRTTRKTYHYDSNGRLDEVRDDYGNLLVGNTYDTTDHWKVSQQTNALGALHDFTEPAAGQVDVVSPNGWKRSYTKNTHGQVTQLRQYVCNFRGGSGRTADPDLHYTWTFDRSSAVCNCGPVTKITEPDGGTIELIYSGSYDLLEVRKVSSEQTGMLVWKWTYDSGHRIATYIPPEGNAANDPTPYTVTVSRQTVAGNLVKTTSIPPRDGRTTPSVWIDTSDSRGRMLDRQGPPHDGTTPSFLGRWDYHATGTGAQSLMPHRAYRFDSTTIAYTYTWDHLGRVVAITDDAARQYTCVYDPEGRATTWTAPTINVGQAYTHKWYYDGNGRVRCLRWKYFSGPLDQTGTWIEWTYNYDALGRMSTQTRQLDSGTTPTMATETWVHDLQDNVLSSTDPDGYVSTVTYDERDLPWVLTDGVGTTEAAVKAYTYNADGRLTQIVEQIDATRSVRFENDYDDFDRLETYRIRNHNTPTAIAGWVESTYDAGSRVQEIRAYSVTSGGTSRLISKKSFVYDDWHECPTQQTTHEYNLENGVLLRSIDSHFDYGPSGRPVREWTGSTLIAEYTYETCGLPKIVQDAYGNRFQVAWDQYGRALTETNAHWSVVDGAHLVQTRTFVRDAFGRATTITDSGSGVTAQVTSFEYDSTDNVVRRTNPDGSSTINEYRFDGALTREDTTISGSTLRARQYQLTAGGRHHVVTDDRNNNVTYVYDGRGRLKQEVYPDSSTWTNEFNAAGLLTKITSPSGRTVDLSYDWRGMLSGRVYKLANGSVLRTDVVEIDLGGFIKKVTKTEAGTTTYVDMVHDSAGRVISETTSLPNSPVWTVSYQHDALGRLQTITTPGGYQHEYTHDDRNRVDTISLTDPTSAAESVADYDYVGAMGAMRRRITGDGNTLQVSRDGFGRIYRMKTDGASNVADFQYGYDAGNRITTEMRGFEGKGNAYWYDKLGRLTKTTKDTTNPTGELANPQSTTHAFHREFFLDGDDHRTQVRTTPMGGAIETTDYTTHGTRHHYTQIQTVGQPAVNRAFDIDGRVASHGTRDFVYDAVDNLIEVQENGQPFVTYEYDALGRRVRKTVDGYVTRFVHAGPWVIEDYRKNLNGTGNEWLKGAYVHGPGIDNVVMMRHRDWKDVDDDVDYVEPVSIYLHANKQGSITEATDPTGQVVERYRYDEFGKVTVLNAAFAVLPAAVVGNWFLFTGREYDWETGYYHYRARTYDPGTGTFLQEDPLGMQDGINVVAYVHADPVNFVDPFGTDGISDAISGILAFINENRDLVADMVMDLLGPLEGILDLMSAATGKDITGWLRGGMKDGEPASMGWWDRACAAAGAAIKIASGGLRLLSKLKGILQKIEAIVEKAKEFVAKYGRKALCKLNGGCFVAGTLVAMADGALVPIEVVLEGQSVRCELPSAFPGQGGEEVDRPVTQTAGRVYEGATITLVVQQGEQRERVSGTPEHPFWVVGRHAWVPMGQVEVGERLDGAAGGVAVVGREVAFARVPVFNFEVDLVHSYRVTGLGVLVHNKCFYEVNEWVDAAGNMQMERGAQVSRNRAKKVLDEGGSVYTPNRSDARGLGSGGAPHGRHVPGGQPHFHHDGGGHVFFGNPGS